MSDETARWVTLRLTESDLDLIAAVLTQSAEAHEKLWKSPHAVPRKLVERAESCTRLAASLDAAWEVAAPESAPAESAESTFGIGPDDELDHVTSGTNKYAALCGKRLTSWWTEGQQDPLTRKWCAYCQSEAAFKDTVTCADPECDSGPAHGSAYCLRHEQP
jgi:hypothetical protein